MIYCIYHATYYYSMLEEIKLPDYLAQTEYGLDLLRSKEPTRLHFFPGIIQV